MVLTTTVAFILLSFGLAFLGWRFLIAFRKTQNLVTSNKTGLLLSICFAATALHNGILGFGALFFANNSRVLYFVSITAHLFLMFFAVVALYTIYYIFLPSKSPYFPIIVTIVLGAIGFLAAIRNPLEPFLTSRTGIDWNMIF